MPWQELIANQSAGWVVTDASCNFIRGWPRFTPYRIWVEDYEFLLIDLVTGPRDPRPAIVHFSLDGQVIGGAVGSDGKATLALGTPQPGFYTLAVFAASRYQIRVSGQTKGCAAPVITEAPPEEVFVPSGTPATLTVKADGRPLTYEWLDVDDFGAAVGAGPTFRTPPVYRPATYIARISAPCGTVSRTNIVRPSLP